MVLYIIRVTRATGTTSFLLLFLSLLLLHFLYSFEEEVRMPCARTWTSLRRHRQTNRERQLFSSSFCCHRRRRCCSPSLLFVPSREKEKATSFFSSMLPTPRCSCSSKTAKLKSVALWTFETRRRRRLSFYRPLRTVSKSWQQVHLSRWPVGRINQRG